MNNNVPICMLSKKCWYVTSIYNAQKGQKDFLNFYSKILQAASYIEFATVYISCITET